MPRSARLPIAADTACVNTRPPKAKFPWVAARISSIRARSNGASNNARYARHTLRVRSIARPFICGRMAAQARSHGVQFNVTVAGKQVILGLHQAGTKASFPQAAAAPVGSIDVLSMQLTYVLHQSRTAIRRRRRNQQMDMVCHQAVRVQSAVRSREQTRKVKEIKPAVLLLMEAVLPIVTPLNDMYRDA